MCIRNVPRPHRTRIGRGLALRAKETFDLVTAVETHYYWPDLDANVREVLHVPKPGGTFALIAETARDRQPNPQSPQRTARRSRSFRKPGRLGTLSGSMILNRARRCIV